MLLNTCSHNHSTSVFKWRNSSRRSSCRRRSLRCPLTRSSTTRLSLTLWSWVRSIRWRTLTIAPSGGLCSGAMSISRGSKHLLQRKSWTRTNNIRPGRSRPSRRKTLVLLRAYALRLLLRLALRRRLLPSLIRIRV